MSVASSAPFRRMTSVTRPAPGVPEQSIRKPPVRRDLKPGLSFQRDISTDLEAVSINPTVLSQSPGAAKRVNHHDQNQHQNQLHNQHHNHNHKNHQKPVAVRHRTAPSPPGFQTPVSHPAPSGFHGSYQVQQSQMPSASRPPMPSSQNQASPQSTTGRTPRAGQASPQRNPMGGRGSPQRRPFVP